MRRRWLWAGALALGAAGAVHWAGEEPDGAAGDVQGRAAAYAARIGLPLPPGTRAEFADWMAGIDAASRLLLVMPEESWNLLRAGLPPVPFERENIYIGPDHGAWAPGRAPGLVAAQFPWREVEVMNIGVAPAGPGEVRVFVFWHQL